MWNTTCIPAVIPEIDGFAFWFKVTVWSWFVATNAGDDPAVIVNGVKDRLAPDPTIMDAVVLVPLVIDENAEEPPPLY
jgi:hypothetical protein